MLPDFETCYRAVTSRDPRFDGAFFTAVSTTGIYCRSICPAQMPRRENVHFYGSAAAAVAAGFRACRRCRPDAVPGSRQWDTRADLAGRALRLIANGTADDGGVATLAGRLHVSERHLHRTLVAEVGAGPLALARTRRAQTARLLLDETDLTMSEVAFAAGFASVRQFNDTMRAEFGATPSHLRAARRTKVLLAAEPGTLALRLRQRPPYDRAGVLDFLRVRAVEGLEHVDATTVTRTVRVPSGPVVVEATPGDTHLNVRFVLRSLDELPLLVASLRRSFDLDADPAAVDELLGADPLLAAEVAARPGLRVPGSPDGFELAVRALLGQRVSVASARASAGRLVGEYGEPVAAPASSGITHAFPTAATLVEAALRGLPVRLAATIRALALEVATGRLGLDPGVDRDDARARLLAVPGIGPWTTEYIAMRAWGDPDAFPATDLILARAVAERGADPDRWHPWRAYAAMHLWNPHLTAAAPPATHRKESS